jgi:2-polyprenyl-3-methyl-5-hydroxy-6-metoxy-1,4-benzoquinol methylase
MSLDSPFTNKIACLICSRQEWDLIDNIKHHIQSFTLTICKNCGFVIQNPPLSTDYLSQYYQNNYVENSYNTNIELTYNNLFRPAKARLEFLQDNSLLEGINRALEIGPGAGSMMKILSDSGIYVTGIEADTTAAEWINAKLNLPVLNGFFNTMYAKHEKKWRKTPFNGIIICHVLEHIINPIIFLEKIKNIISTDGKIIIEVPNIERPFSDTNKWESYCDPGHLYYFSKNSLENLLRIADLKVLNITDSVFEPFGNLLCVAKTMDESTNTVNCKVYYDDYKSIKKIWKTFKRYHIFKFYKNKIFGKIKRLFNSK